jgi:tetratricopeptide (TPR) repeat protein
MRSLDDSIKIYQEIRNTARQKNNIKAEKKASNILGELYLAKFDYINAAETYELLLAQAQTEKNAYDEGLYLQKLAEIYTKSSLSENAVQMKERLVTHYFKDQKIELISDLKVAIGDDYDTLNKPEKASQNYQEAFTLSWSLQQYGSASLALKKLATLYKNHNQPNYALQIYQKLLKVEQQSYNYYGLMKVYEAIGQIYQEAKQYPPALKAYQQALILARSLKYQDGEDYFVNQIQTINTESQGANPANSPNPKP